MGELFDIFQNNPKAIFEKLTSRIYYIILPYTDNYLKTGLYINQLANSFIHEF